MDYELLLEPIGSTKGAFCIYNGKNYVILAEDLPISETTEVIDNLIMQATDYYAAKKRKEC